jgi:formamidopyrimidine-DNA glycosylase
MPELPEVETVKRGLERLVVGKTIETIEHNADKSFPNAQAQVDSFLIGSEVVAVQRRAKLLMIKLSTNYTLMVHLKMTGQLVFNGSERWGAGHPNDSLIDELPNRSTRVTINFSDGTKLFFNDQRRFGWVKAVHDAELEHEPFLQKVGPEPLEESFTDRVFTERVRRRSGTTIKAAILDQSVLAGVGNIYADEGLWMSKIHPATRVRAVTDSQLKNLRISLVSVLQLSIDKGGSTNKNYVDAEGKKGSYMDFANIFRREGKLCNRCGTVVEKIRVAGRGTHICPRCQKQVE